MLQEYVNLVTMLTVEDVLLRIQLFVICAKTHGLDTTETVLKSVKKNNTYTEKKETRPAELAQIFAELALQRINVILA